MKRFILIVFFLFNSLLAFAQIQEVGGGKNTTSICVGEEVDNKTKRVLIHLLEKFYDKKTKTFGRIDPKKLPESDEIKLMKSFQTLDEDVCNESFPITYSLLASLVKQPIVIAVYPKEHDEYIKSRLQKASKSYQNNWCVGDCLVLEGLKLIPNIKNGDQIPQQSKGVVGNIINDLKTKLTRKK
jgi:hypothetical protein